MSRILLSALFLAFTLGSLQAATFRYEFDIVSSDLTFGILRGGPYLDPIDRNDPTFQTVVSELHVLRDLEGQTGHYVIEASFDGISLETGSQISCLQGLGCPFFLESSYVIPDQNGFITGYSGLDWALQAGQNGSGLLSFIDDRYVGDGVVDGVGYFFLGPTAEFGVENLTITDLSAVPLPATGLLLVFAFAPFLLRRRS